MKRRTFGIVSAHAVPGIAGLTGLSCGKADITTSGRQMAVESGGTLAGKKLDELRRQYRYDPVSYTHLRAHET